MAKVSDALRSKSGVFYYPKKKTYVILDFSEAFDDSSGDDMKLFDRASVSDENFTGEIIRDQSLKLDGDYNDVEIIISLVWSGYDNCKRRQYNKITEILQVISNRTNSKIREVYVSGKKKIKYKQLYHCGKKSLYDYVFVEKKGGDVDLKKALSRMKKKITIVICDGRLDISNINDLCIVISISSNSTLLCKKNVVAFSKFNWEEKVSRFVVDIRKSV